MKWYRTEEEAFAQVRRLRRELGIWPGITGAVREDGLWWWRLVFDPPDVVPALWHGFTA